MSPATAAVDTAEDVFRRRRGKPVGKWGKLRDEQLRLLHRFHLEREASIRELAREISAQAGYASEGSALEGIRAGWKRLGLEARSQPQATALANRRRRVPGSPGTADRAANKRFHRRRNGGYRRCQGSRSTYPRKGDPCERWALVGGDFCLQHDPERRAEVLAIVAGAREAIT